MKSELKIKLDTMKCKACTSKKKVDILEITGGGNKIKYAPCKACGCENFLSIEDWVRGPAEIDLTEDEEITQYFADIYNLADFLKDENGQSTVNEQMLSFIRLLRKAGRSELDISKFITNAAYRTRFGGARTGVENGVTYALGCGQDVPRVLPNRGDWKEWMRLRPRAI